MCVLRCLLQFLCCLFDACGSAHFAGRMIACRGIPLVNCKHTPNLAFFLSSPSESGNSANPERERASPESFWPSAATIGGGGGHRVDVFARGESPGRTAAAPIVFESKRPPPEQQRRPLRCTKA